MAAPTKSANKTLQEDADGHSLPKQYRPAEHEERVFDAWVRDGAFHADPARVLSGGAKPFAILIPPPNVTDRLHLGHALNNTLQDVLTRAHRMKGFESLWMPGTDHAGIATQTVVEKRLLREEGKRRTEYTRGEFVAKVQAFKDEYEAAITDQLKRLGCSCDWDRQRFTMDEVCARAVRQAFFMFFRDKLIYRGKRLVNWDPATQTALADDEVESEEIDGFFYYLRYPLAHKASNPTDQHDVQEVTWSELARRGYPGAEKMPEDDVAWITVATTRPETYLGDTGVAVNPRDPRAVPLRGLMVQLPIVGRVIPIVEDDYVVMPDAESSDAKARYATGFLKVTPAHDTNDFEIGRRHALETINVMAPDASISDKHGWERETRREGGHVFVGKSREAARELVVREFQARKLLENKRPYRHAVGHSYRSHVPIEPYLSDQWYVKVTDDRLVGAAQRALAPEQRTSETFPPRGGVMHDGVLRFYPARYAKNYEMWHDNLRDWCISRQLWWGHRIPVWKKRAKQEASGADAAALIGDRVARDIAANKDWLAYQERVVELDAKTHELHVYLCVAPGHEGYEQELESAGWERDPDVLDTWFSSALWPMSTMGWPDARAAAQATGTRDFDQLLPAFNPTTVLSTAREIITLWVSRMVMFNRYLLSETDGVAHGSARPPFRGVFVHAIVQDGQGQKMSKSLGNGVNPLDIVESHGADALRLSLCQLSTGTQDVRMPLDLVCPKCAHQFEPAMFVNEAGYTVTRPIQACPSCSKKMATLYGVFCGEAKVCDDLPLARATSSRFDAARNFCNKLWNAARFALSMLEGGVPERVTHKETSLADRWMLGRVARCAHECDAALADYNFAHYTQAIYDLMWRDFCDWYIEAIKPTAKSSPAQRGVLRATLDAILRLLHPVLPFVTETLHGALARVPVCEVEGLTLAPPRRGSSLCMAGWPEMSVAIASESSELFVRAQEIVTQIRAARAQHQVKPRQMVTLHAPADFISSLGESADLIRSLAGVESLSSAAAPRGSPLVMIGATELFISGHIDAADAGTERDRLLKEIEAKSKTRDALAGRLSNASYIERAPAHLVDQSRAQLAQAEAELSQLRASLEQIG